MHNKDMKIYVIVDHGEGSVFHLTLLPAFRVDTEDQVNKFIDRVKNACFYFGPVTTSNQGEQVFYGDDGEAIHVIEVLKSNQISTMHDHLLRAAIDSGASLAVPEHHGEGYLPHVTGASMEGKNEPFNWIHVSRGTLDDEGVKGFETLFSYCMG